MTEKSRIAVAGGTGLPGPRRTSTLAAEFRVRSGSSATRNLEI